MSLWWWVGRWREKEKWAFIDARGGGEEGEESEYAGTEW